ncbi:aldehyde dehydrogenase family protein, partial [Saccharomonospora iraqiensis]|uniref:aldehyde dehydrogenase family protein n=1 Tax=Saccharomonospora iraqiensis TaxID=52698 RepID=UPI000490C44C
MEGMDTITPRPRPMWLAGRAEDGDDTRPVTHPHDATEIATVAVADTATTDRAVTEVARFAGGMRSWPVADRAAALDAVAQALAGRGDELAEIVTAESGKPLRHAETEVAHAVATLRAGARSAGETRHLDGRTDDGGLTLTRRVPRG